MNQISKVLWGIVFILVGVIIGLDSFGVIDVNLFFDGWWTLFIIVPCFIGLFSEKEGKVGSLIGLLVGILFLLASCDVLTFEVIAKLIVPIICVLIGLSMIFNNTLKRKVALKVREKSKDGLESIVATFSQQKAVKDKEKFEGANLEAVFGNVVLDLRKSLIEDEAVIKVSSIFGGVQIIAPKDVNVSVKSTPIFGGVSNKVLNEKENKKIIYIEALALFGGVDIK